MKNYIIQILEGKLYGANDNLYRFKMAARNHSLDEQYGQSGRTYAEIMTQYQSEVITIQKAINWIREK